MNGSTALVTARESAEHASLPPHAPAICGFIYTHRFATAAHVRDRFGFPSLRTVQHQLKRLVDCGYLATVLIRAALPTHPHVYLTTARGRHLIAAAYRSRTGRTWPVGRGEVRRPGRSVGLQHIAHELAVTTLDVALLRHIEHRPDITLTGIQRRYHLAHHRLSHDLQPDAGYHLVHHRPDRRFFEWCALEYDRGTMRPQAMRDKLHRYQHWSRSAAAKQYLAALHRQHGDTRTTSPSFRLLIVAQARPGEGSDHDRLATIAAIAAALDSPLRRRIWLTTTARLVANRYHLSAPIWHRARSERRLTLFPPPNP